MTEEPKTTAERLAALKAAAQSRATETAKPKDLDEPAEDTIKSTRERLAALHAGTGAHFQTARSTAEEALGKLEAASAQEVEDRANAARESVRAAAEKAEKSPVRVAARVLKGDEKKNIKNLYGLTNVFASITAPLVGPASAVARVTGLAWTFRKAVDAWEDYGGPIRWAAGGVNQTVVKPAVWWTKLHWDLYKKAAVTHHDDGTKTNHYARGIASIAFSLAATAAVTGAIVDTPVLGYEAAMYATTAKTEPMYLNGVHVVPGADTAFYTGGCKTAPCTEENSMPMKIQQSQFLVIKSLIDSHGKNLWRPETIMTAIPNQSVQCTVTHAGLRWRIANKLFDVYPYVANVSCSEPADTARPPVVVIPHAPYAAPAAVHAPATMEAH